MSSSDDEHFTFSDADKRPSVTPYAQRPAFRRGDKVYLLRPDGSRDGPFLIASVSQAGKFTLCYEDGRVARNGEQVSSENLEAF